MHAMEHGGPIGSPRARCQQLAHRTATRFPGLRLHVDRRFRGAHARHLARGRGSGQLVRPGSGLSLADSVRCSRRVDGSLEMTARLATARTARGQGQTIPAIRQRAIRKATTSKNFGRSLLSKPSPISRSGRDAYGEPSSRVHCFGRDHAERGGSPRCRSTHTSNMAPSGKRRRRDDRRHPSRIEPNAC